MISEQFVNFPLSHGKSNQGWIPFSFDGIDAKPFEIAAVICICREICDANPGKRPVSQIREKEHSTEIVLLQQ